MIGNAFHCGLEILCIWEVLWRGHLKRVLSLFCDREMSLYDKLLLHKIEPNDPFLAKYVLELCSAHLQLPSSPMAPTATAQVDWGQKRNCLVQKLPSTKKMQKPIKCGFILLAADATLCQQTRVEVPPHAQLFQDLFKLFKKPKSRQFPTTSPLEPDIQISISNCMTMPACCRTWHFGLHGKAREYIHLKLLQNYNPTTVWLDL